MGFVDDVDGAGNCWVNRARIWGSALVWTCARASLKLTARGNGAPSQTTSAGDAIAPGVRVFPTEVERASVVFDDEESVPVACVYLLA